MKKIDKKALIDQLFEKNSKFENNNSKTRKKREELSVSATKSIKKEKVEIVVNFT